MVKFSSETAGRHPEAKDIVSNRTIEVLMVRHGKQNSYEAQTDTPLSPEGEKQAEQFANELLTNYAGRRVAFKIKHSGIERADRTADIIEQILENRITTDGLENLRVLKTRQHDSLKATGTLGPLLNSGVAYEKSVDEWLANSDKYEGSRTPEEIASLIKDYVGHTNELIKRLPDKGEDLVIIWVTHETAHAALMNTLTNKNTAELGGGIGHLETLKFSFSKDSVPTAEFRGQKFDLETKRED